MDRKTIEIARFHRRLYRPTVCQQLSQKTCMPHLLYLDNLSENRPQRRPQNQPSSSRLRQFLH